MSLSSSCSHVAVAYISHPQSGEKEKKTTGDGDTKLAFYSLPVNSWMAELPRTFDENSQVSMASQGKVGGGGEANHCKLCSSFFTIGTDVFQAVPAVHSVFTPSPHPFHCHSLQHLPEVLVTLARLGSLHIRASRYPLFRG